MNKNSTRVCVPIKKSSSKEVLRDFKKSQKIADLTEVWFDEIDDLRNADFKKITAVKSKPLIYKVTKQNKLYEDILRIIDYIDFDIKTSNSKITNAKKSNPKIKLIISFHDFKKTPSSNELKLITKKAIAKGADIVKIAAYARDFTDTMKMFESLTQLQKQRKDAICICMGKEGLLTRTAGHLLGNYLMYAPIDKSGSTADGQITVAELRKIQKLRNL